ncbi:B12-binding domain-containing radical SAM protein [Clostridium massiliodielmoense]|uniref:B12-binding domain-containing radical SAM protein n=1 Tax=Clostridium massiliodielmoense TaxID=1776385 RepID=UPI000A26DB22|nr:B12-binding domain-containing radical SAM protein [Clostridium massiliodielmoense]
MKKLKTLLVGINSKYIHSNLAIRYLKEYTKQLDYECKIREFSINDRRKRILKEIINEDADIICFSCYIWNIELVKELASLIRIVNSNIKIIYGGPEVSFDGKEFLSSNPGEYLIEGEGEETFKELIQLEIYNFKNNISDAELKNNFTNEDSFGKIDETNKSLSEIEGLFYKINKKVFYNGKRRNMDINQVIFPYDENDNLKNKIVYYEASRGCPYGCKYCLSSVDRNLRFRNIETVKKELKYFIDKEVRMVKFVDRTFNANEKFAIDIWDFLIGQDTNTKFHFEISANILTENQFNVLSRAPKGRLQFEVGVQTTNNEILRNINRYVNFEDIEEKVEEIKKLNNISQHLDLIAGLPGENLKSFINSFNDVYSIKPEEIQLGFLKLLKGSPMLEEKDKWGMKYSPYPPYEILSTNDISYNEILLLKKVEAMVDKYYNSGKFNNIISYFELKFDTPFEFYYQLGEFFEEKGYFDRNISGTDYYKVFLEFNSEKLRQDNDILKDVIKYDYVKYNKKNWVPKFLERKINKKLTNEIKEKIINSNPGANKNKLYLQEFDIDINEFINNKKIINKNVYLVYDGEDEDNIIDVTEII